MAIYRGLIRGFLAGVLLTLIVGGGIGYLYYKRIQSQLSPEFIQKTAETVLAHRLLHADPLVGDGWERSRSERAVIRSVLESIPVPR